MKRKITLAALIVAMTVGALFVLRLGGTSTFDVLGFALLLVRMLAWALVVAFYYPLNAALGDDDLEQDYARINDGNTAVAVFRGLEFAVVGITAAMLISKI